MGDTGTSPSPPSRVEAVDDLALLELELRLVAHVLEPAAAAAPEVRARGVGAEIRRAVDPLDRAPGEPWPDLRQPDLDAVARHPAGDEHDVAAGPRDPLAPERQVGHVHGQEIAAPRRGHGALHATAGPQCRQRSRLRAGSWMIRLWAELSMA